MTDLMKLKIRRAQDVFLSQGGVTVQAPWASIEVEPIEIPTGWFRLFNPEGSAVCVQLTQRDGFKVVEMSAGSGGSTFVRFEGGCFQPKLFFGARPGFYPVTKVMLLQLTFTERLVFFASKFFKGLFAGVGFKRLFQMVLLALIGKGTFGVSPSLRKAGFPLGILTTLDAKPVNFLNSDYEARIGKLRWKPMFLVSCRDGGVAHVDAIVGLVSQVYKHFHTDPLAEFDYQLIVDPDEGLSADALLLFAEAAVKSPERQVIVADVWRNGIPTMRPAFDPLLYGVDNYPTPFLLKKRTPSMTPASWADFEALHEIISVPVANSWSKAKQPNLDVKTFNNKAVVSVIIPTRDRADLLECALAGLFENTDWPHEVIIVDNGSVQAETFELFERYVQSGMRIIRSDTEFNFSKLCNVGATVSSGEILIFMNNDIQLMNREWMAEMVRYARLPQIGAVGARLHYSDLSLQHGGIALGLAGVCGHLYNGLSLEDQEAIPSLINPSVRSAVTGALLCIEKDVFFSVGGFDEIDFPVTLNDVDLCLKLRAKGLFNAYVPSAQAFHHEGASRGPDLSKVKLARRFAELSRFTQKWPAELWVDPWLPDALSKASEYPQFR